MTVVRAVSWHRCIAIVRDGWDRLSIYLPLIVMGLLALGSYWVLRTAPTMSEATPPRPVRHEPDYFMKGFSVRTHYSDGSLKSEVFGTEARHYPDSDTMEVDQPRIRYIGETGLLTKATARLARSNGSQTEFWLEGNVNVVREARAGLNGNGQATISPEVTFQGEQLKIQTDSKLITSDAPVLMTRGTDRITANTLHYDDNTRVANLQGRIRATLAPRR